MTADLSMSATASIARDAQVHVMLVDDSAVIRSLMYQILATDPSIKVAASAANGQTAIQLFQKTDVRVVVLDIEMPVMDGLSAIPKLLEIDPDVKIIMASTLTLRNAEISLKALELGAADYIPKPTAPRDISAEGDFRRELLAKVKSHGLRPRQRPRRVPLGETKFHAPAAVVAPSLPRKIKLRQPGLFRPEVIAIGSSTGGPQALFTFLAALPASLSAPIVITQHMPPTFTAVLAQHVARICTRPCHELVNGETLKAGSVYIAPGDHHLIVDKSGTNLVGHLSQGPAENYCRPSVDPMLRSLAQAAGNRVLAVVLTGMGSDGLAGSQKVVEAGGTVVAQDEASSVVWGMPGAVANAGLCSAVLPLRELAAYVVQLFEGHAS